MAIDDETMKMLIRQSKRERETANVGERLLAQGKSIVYWKPGLASNEHIHEFPDGKKLLVRMENGEVISEEPYDG